MPVKRTVKRRNCEKLDFFFTLKFSNSRRETFSCRRTKWHVRCMVNSSYRTGSPLHLFHFHSISISLWRLWLHRRIFVLFLSSLYTRGSIFLYVLYIFLYIFAFIQLQPEQQQTSNHLKTIIKNMLPKSVTLSFTLFIQIPLIPFQIDFYIIFVCRSLCVDHYYHFFSYVFIRLIIYNCSFSIKLEKKIIQLLMETQLTVV